MANNGITRESEPGGISVVRALLSVLLGTVGLMIGGFVYFALLPTIAGTTENLAPDDPVVAALRGRASGTYLYPPVLTDMTEQAVQESVRLHKEGPIFQVFVARPVDPSMLAGLALSAVSALVMTGLLAMARPGTYAGRLGLVMVGGSLVALSRLSMPAWFHHPWEFHVMYAVGELCTWACAAVLMATVPLVRGTSSDKSRIRVVRPQDQSSPVGVGSMDDGVRAFGVRLLSRGNSPIPVIKAVREATGLGLKESKDIVDRTPSLLRNSMTEREATALAQTLRQAGATAEVFEQ